MFNFGKKWLVVLLLFLFLFPNFCLGAVSESIPNVNGGSWFTDVTNTINSNDLTVLNEEAKKFEEIGFQAAGIAVKNASNPSAFASDFGNKNGVGSRSKNNGLVILVMMDKTGSDGCKPSVFVAPGKGLEGTLNDAKVTRMLRQYFVPLRKQGKWVAGLVLYMQKTRSYLHDPKNKEFQDDKKDQGNNGLMIFIIVLIIIIVLLALVGGSGGSGGGYFVGGGGGGGSSGFSGGGGSFGGGGGGA